MGSALALSLDDCALAPVVDEQALRRLFAVVQRARFEATLRVLEYEPGDVDDGQFQCLVERVPGQVQQFVR